MDAPLDGLLVLDLTRMLPGAVVARQLLDLGARVVKVEDPAGGDPMRQVPPQRDGVGVGFAALLRGAESVCLDLRSTVDAETLARMARRADVLVESFRPGTMERWGVGRERLTAANPGLVWCSLSGWGSGPATAHLVGHDLNFAATTGTLELLGGGIPRLQLADVGAALLASSGIMAALLRRQRSGHGAFLDQPLVSGALPFLVWAWAETAAGGDGVLDTLLAGRLPCYRTYSCGDGGRVALSVLEPKLWLSFLDLVGRPDLAATGADPGEPGERAAAEIEAALRTRSRAEWLALAAERGLPLSAHNDLAAAVADPFFPAAGLVEATPMPGGGTLLTPGPFLPSLGQTPTRPAPRLGEHTVAVVAELGALGDQDLRE